MKDDIDFGTTDIKILFRKMLYPTVASMVFSALFIIIDGIFVGRGVGSDALAAVNIVAPVWLFATSIGLMFGMGGAVTVSVNMARGKQETARKNMTQAIAVSSVFLLICTVLILVYVDKVLMLLGCSPRLYAPAKDYIWGFVPFMTINALLCSTPFFIRLDASPRYAMTANVIATVLNIIFDYLFIFIFRWGIFGAAIATSLGSVVGVAIMLRPDTFRPVEDNPQVVKQHGTQYRAGMQDMVFLVFVRNNHSGHDVVRKLCLHVIYRRTRCSRIQHSMLFLPDNIYAVQFNCAVGTTDNKLQLRSLVLSESTLCIQDSIENRGNLRRAVFCRHLRTQCAHNIAVYKFRRCRI